MDALLIQKKKEENEYLQQQAEKWKDEDKFFDQVKEVSEVYEHRHYSFLARKENAVDWHYGVGAEIKKEAEPAVPPEGWEMIDQQRDLSKAEQNVVAQEKKMNERQYKLAEMRQKDPENKQTGRKAKERSRMEQGYLNDKLDLIRLQAAADIEKVRNERDRLEIEVNKHKAIVDAWTDYVKTLEPGTKKRKNALKSKENAQLDLYWAQYKLKLDKTEPAQKKKANAKYKRKVAEAYIKAVISASDENCHEDHIIETEINGVHLRLVNMGRAFLGGTKPTYYYKDMKTGQQYLYKKAENCCGVHKPEGAIVTEIGSKIQHIVDPEHEIPAIGIKNAKGKYIGSIQKIVDVMDKPTIDFDAWQLNSKEKGGQDEKVVKNPEIQKQLLIFHCVDWLLCNFDTKGEHLLQCKDGSFVSIDKEGGMNQILKEDSQSMSCTYSPHNHEPIYNVFFRMVRDKKIDLDPTALEALDQKVQAVEAYSEEEYMQMFEPYILQVNKDPEKMRANIKKRKKDLRKEYNRFLSSLREGLVLPENK